MTGATVDAHHHFWWTGATGRDYSTRADTQAIHRDFTPDDLDPLRRQAGVERTVVIQTKNAVDETRRLIEVSEGIEWVAGVVGWVPLTDPASLNDTLDELTEHRLFCGVRHLTSLEANQDWLIEPQVLSGLAQLAGRGIPFDNVPETAPQLRNLIQVARTLPDLPVIIDHLARPPVPEGGWEPWASLVSEAAAVPNMAMKLSVGLDVLRRWGVWDPAVLQPYVDHVIAAFGPDRLLAASNWPPLVLAAGYTDAWDHLRSAISELTPDEQASVLGGTATRWYRLG